MIHTCDLFWFDLISEIKIYLQIHLVQWRHLLGKIVLVTCDITSDL